MVRYETRFYLSTVDPNRSTGYLICFDGTGQLLDQMSLTQAECFHPGGFSVKDGISLIPVAEYRPHSSSIICRVDLERHKVDTVFRYDDHLGAAAETCSSDVVAATWGSRELVRFSAEGEELLRVPNASHFIDLQDFQLCEQDTLICTGLAEMTVGEVAAQVGGIALLDVDRWKIVNEVPFPGYSPSGRVATSNPTWFERSGSTLMMYAIPDDGASELLLWATELCDGNRSAESEEA